MRRRRITTLLSFALCCVLVFAVGLSLVVGSGARGVFGALLAAIMLAIAITDAQRYIIPDALTAAAILLALLYNGWASPDAGSQAVMLMSVRTLAASAPLLLLLLLYRMWRGRDGMGLGDVKLAAVAGAWLDWLTIAGVIELAAVSALTAYVLRSRITGQPMRATSAMPFGMFFAPAIWIGWLAETWLIY